MTWPALLLFIAAILIGSGNAIAADATVQSVWVYKCEQQLTLNETLVADEYMVRLVEVSATPIGPYATVDVYQRMGFVGRLSIYGGEERQVSDLKISLREVDAQAKRVLIRLEKREEARTHQKVAELELKKGESTAPMEHGIENITLLEVGVEGVNVSVLTEAGMRQEHIELGHFVELEGTRLKLELCDRERGAARLGVYGPASADLSVSITPSLDMHRGVLTYTVELLNTGGGDAFTLSLVHGTNLSQNQTESIHRLEAHTSVRYVEHVPVEAEPEEMDVLIWARVLGYDVYQHPLQREARAKLTVPSCVNITKNVRYTGGFPQSGNGKVVVELSITNACNRTLEVELVDGLPEGFRSNERLAWQLTLSPHATRSLEYEATATSDVVPGVHTAPAPALSWRLDSREGAVVGEPVDFLVHGPHLEAVQQPSGQWVELALTNVGDEDAMDVKVHIPVDVRWVIQTFPEASLRPEGVMWYIQRILPHQTVHLRYRLNAPENTTPSAEITFYDPIVEQLGRTYSSHVEPPMPHPLEAPSSPTPAPAPTRTEEQPVNMRDIASYTVLMLVLFCVPALIIFLIMG